MAMLMNHLAKWWLHDSPPPLLSSFHFGVHIEFKNGVRINLDEVASF